MNKFVPIYYHLGRIKPTRMACRGFAPCISWDSKLLATSSPLTSSFPQRRSLATNRRKQRLGMAAKAKNESRQEKKRPRGKNSRHRDQERTMIRPPKNYMKKLPQKELTIPPALLVPTASPYVYIAQTALESGDDDDDDDPIDPSTLFSEVAYNDDGVLTLPTLFAKGDFHYFSPKKDLSYDYPTDGRPEIAFLGRSNVGKSSLINAVMRKNLCLTSRTPGRTQLPYYYGLIPKHLMEQQRHKKDRNDPQLAQGFIVDLPGYGYGRAPTNITENWQQDTQDLLLHRRHEAGVLRRLYLLMDARRGMEGPNEHDRIVMRWLEDAEIPFSIVLTKADRVSVPLVVKQVNDFCLRYASQEHHHNAVAQSPVVHVTSSSQGWGIHELMVSIEAEFCEEDPEEEDDDSLEY